MKWACFAIVLAMISPAFGQTTRPDAAASPATRPAVTPLPADQMLQQMLRPPAGGEKVTPIRPEAGPPANDAKSGGGALAPGAPTVSLLREGTDIVDRVGRLQHGAEGKESEFVFDSDGRTMRDPPMIILPNLKLMSMETAVNAANRDLQFRITGTVTEYRGRNYILLDKVVVVDDKSKDF